MQHEDTMLHSLLSKKIADLVKVVDKLFRSNHTAQLENVFLRKDLVEFEALRKENEALKEKVDALEGKVREADERLKHECEKLKELHRLEMDKLYEEMKSREEAILDELRERDHALSDMEHELGRKTMQTKELQSNLSEYKKRYKAASSSGRDAKEENNGLVSELMAVKSSMESMEEEIEAMRLEKNGLKKKFERQWDVERASWKGEKCKLREKIDALQDQVQKLQSRLLRTTHSSQGSHESVGSCESSHSAHKRQGVSSGAVMDKEAVLELERLRQEVSWYRLELMNREGNFNRMFAPHSPVSVAAPTVSTAAWKCAPLPKLEPKDSLLTRTKSLKISNRTAVFTARH